jgi:hypothetical protein
MDLWMDLFGSIGLIFLLSAFIINHYKKIPRRTLVFNGLNFFGSGILTIYAYHIGSNVFMALNGIWVIVSGYYLSDILHAQYLFKTEKVPKKKE